MSKAGTPNEVPLSLKTYWGSLWKVSTYSSLLQLFLALHNGVIISWPPSPPQLFHQLHLDDIFFFLISVRSCTDEHSAPVPRGGGCAGAAFVVITFPKRQRTDSRAFPLLLIFFHSANHPCRIFWRDILYTANTRKPQRLLVAARCSTFLIKLSVACYSCLADTDKLSWCGQTNRAHMGSDIARSTCGPPAIDQSESFLHEMYSFCFLLRRPALPMADAWLLTSITETRS